MFPKNIHKLNDGDKAFHSGGIFNLSCHLAVVYKYICLPLSPKNILNDGDQYTHIYLMIISYNFSIGISINIELVREEWSEEWVEICEKHLLNSDRLKWKDFMWLYTLLGSYTSNQSKTSYNSDIKT